MSVKIRKLPTKTFYNQKTKIWHGEIVAPRFGDQDSIGSVALKSMLENPEYIGQICYTNGKQFTNLEIAKRSIQVAQHFGKLQMKQGDVIGFCVPNSDYLAPLFFGAMAAGLCVSTLDPSYDKDCIKAICSLSKPRIMFCDGANYHMVKEVLEECGLSSCKIFTVNRHFEGVPNILEFFSGSIETSSYRVPALERGCDQVALIIWSSGKSHIPKGICISHSAILHYPTWYESDLTNIRLLCFGALHLLEGLISLILGTINGATRIISENPFTAKDFFDIVKLYKANIWVGVPSQMELALSSSKLNESDLSSLKLCIIAATFDSHTLIEKFKEFANNAEYFVTYNLDEICSAILLDTICESNSKVGKLPSNIEVKILHDNGTQLGPNEIGKICVRSKFPWSGYFNNPEATKAVYDDADWFHSGDKGYFHDDRQLFLMDRKSSLPQMGISADSQNGSPAANGPLDDKVRKKSSSMPCTFYNEESKIWHGAVVEPRYGPEHSIGSVALNAMRNNPDRIIQICYQSGKQFTSREMARHSVQAARHFQKLNLEQCDMVGMCVANSDYVAPLFFGAMFCGLCLSNSDPSFNANGLKHIYSMSRPKLMFCDGENYEKVRQAFNEIGLSSCRIYIVRNYLEGVPNILEFFEEVGDEDTFRLPNLKYGSDQVAVVVCTSGSTDLPKGVRMSHTALLNANYLAVDFPIRVLCFSSIFWTLGVLHIMQSATEGLTRIISEQPFTVDDFIDIVKLYKVNITGNSPSHIPLCLASGKLATSDLSSVRFMFVTGKTICYDVYKKLKPFMPNCIFSTFYGLTEGCGAATSTIADPSNSVGKLLANVEMKILNDEGKHLGPNETGEIVLRKRFSGSGYQSNPRAMYDENGWIHTGDMGYFNDDGLLYVVDRRTDILKYNNFHFAPATIEKVICEMPGVAEACVVGIPDSIYDFLPAAAIIKNHEAQITESDISKHVANRMQHFENLHGGVYFFSNLPQTASGKTKRSEVTELCKNRRKQLEKYKEEFGAIFPIA